MTAVDVSLPPGTVIRVTHYGVCQVSKHVVLDAGAGETDYYEVRALGYPYGDHLIDTSDVQEILWHS